MDTSTGPIAAHRRYWLPELIVLVALSIVAIVLFTASGLDIETMRPFYHPDHVDPWSNKEQPLWSLFYRSAPWITASLAVAGVALFVLGVIREHSRRLRWYGVFVLLSVTLGPGLIINLVLKDHWGRPRPRQMVEFGGRYEYVQPFVPVPFNTPRKSFPCGHCSVGYLYAAGWWLWRRRRPRCAAGSLAAGSARGTLLGIGRMAAGGHFLSDVVWSGLLAFGVAHALYYYVLRIPAREDSRADVYPLIERRPGARAAVIAATVLLGLGIVGGGVLATPHHRDLAERVRLADFPLAPEAVAVRVDTLDIEIRVVADPPGEIACEGYVHGFGLPTNE